MNGKEKWIKKQNMKTTKESKKTSPQAIRTSFNAFFGEDIFVDSRKRDVADKRQAAYTFMHEIMNMNYREIGEVSGRTHATVLEGVRRFKDLLEINDERATYIYNKILKNCPLRK